MKAIDILLVNPKNRLNRPAYIPYGILYVASYLRKCGVTVRIFDRNAEVETFKESLERQRPRIVGFSVLTGPTINDAIELSKQVKEFRKDTPVVWGGIHPTLFTKQCLVEPYIDIVVCGEGELTAVEMTRAILDGKDLNGIYGLSFKDHGRAVTVPLRPLIKNLDEEIPLPAWDLLDMRQYIGPKFYASRVVTFNTSRGCHFRCAFCHNPLSHNRRNWRGLSARKIIEGIELLKNQYKVNGIFFFEDEFDSDRDRVREMVDLMLQKRLNIKWHKHTRVNFVTSVEAVRKEYEAGLRFVEFGVESGSDRMLSFIKKDQTTDMVRRAFNICRESGVKTSALFILGLPTETREEFEMTKKFVVELNPHIYIPAFFKPFPGSKLYQYCIDHEGLIIPSNLAEIGNLYSMCESQAFSYSKAPPEEITQFVSFCNMMNLRNEFKEALKTFNVRFMMQGLEFAIKNGGYKQFFRIGWLARPRLVRPTASDKR